MGRVKRFPRAASEAASEEGESGSTLLDTATRSPAQRLCTRDGGEGHASRPAEPPHDIRKPQRLEFNMISEPVIAATTYSQKPNLQLMAGFLITTFHLQRFPQKPLFPPKLSGVSISF